MSNWKAKAEAVAADTRDALQIVYKALNKGQRKKIIKEVAVKNLFDHYDVDYEDDEKDTSGLLTEDDE